MPDFCAAFGCTNSSDKPSCKERKISFHRFPLKDIRRLNVWILKLRRQDYSPTSASVLCSEHFNEEDFEYQPFTNRRGLKKTAVPSKFSYVPVRIPKQQENKSPSLLPDIPISESEDSLDRYPSVQNSQDKNSERKEVDESNVSPLSSNLKTQTSSVKKFLSFQEIVKNLYSITRPNSLWSVVCTEKFIIFGRWNDDFDAEKRIVIEKNATIRIFLKKLEINLTDLMEITCVTDISELLEKVESINIS